MAEPLARRFQPTPFVTGSLALHGLGAAALVASPALWPVVAGALVLDHLVIGAAGMWPRSSLLGPNLRRLASPGVALTFDDGPHPTVTPEVLDVLDRRGAKATFFCIGRRVERHPALAREIVARGHSVQNHSYSHPNTFALSGPRGIEREVRRAQDVITDATGERPRWFRAPAGIRNPWVEPCLARLGLSLVSWTRRGFDTVSRDGAAVTDRLARGLAAGDILVLHDGNSARATEGRLVALQALDSLLDLLQSRGLPTVTLPGDHAVAAR